MSCFAKCSVCTFQPPLYEEATPRSGACPGMHGIFVTRLTDKRTNQWTKLGDGLNPCLTDFTNMWDNWKGGIVARQNSGPQQNLKTQKSYNRPMRQPNQMKNWLQPKYLISTYLQSATSEKKTETYVQSQQTNTKTSNKRDVKQLECTQNLPKKPIRVQQFWQKLLVPILLVSHYPQLSS